MPVLRRCAIPCLVPLLAVGSLAGLAASSADGEGAKPRMVVERLNPWSSLEFNNDPDNFQFAIVTDRTGGHRPGVFPDAVKKLNLLQPEFVMSVGDLIEGYTEDQAQLDLEWDEFNGFIDGLEVPFFYLPGNHDITNEVMARDWERRFGRSYYHFVYRDVLFLCLNTEDPPASQISPEQVEYAARALAENKDVRWTLVFQHKPLWVYDDAPGWAEIEALLAGREHTVFAGHFHTYTKYERNDGKYFVLATTGGGSGLRGPLYGQFDHVVWVTMTDGGPRIANLMLEGIWDEDVRNEETMQLVDALLQGRALGVQPIFAEGAEFAGGVSKIRLRNDSDVPLEISGAFAVGGPLTVEPGSFERTLAPNSIEDVPLKVRAASAVAVGDLKPVALEWKARYTEGLLDELSVEERASLVVSRTYNLPRRRDAVRVDGRLDEWGELPFVVEDPVAIQSDASSWTGPEDCSFRFAVELGEEYLYVAVEVKDERPIYRQGVPWTQDGIEVRIDGRPDPARSSGRGGGDLEMRDFLFVALSPDADPAKMLTVEGERLASFGVQAVCLATPTGHRTEIAVPRAYFEGLQGSDWRALRFNIAVDDVDEKDGNLAQLWWQPDWRNAGNFAGSGTFRRE